MRCEDEVSNIMRCEDEVSNIMRDIGGRERAKKDLRHENNK